MRNGRTSRNWKVDIFCWRIQTAARRRCKVSLPAAIAYIRREWAVGDHLHRCFADQNTRAEGWKRMQAARRIARRLGLANLYTN